MLAVRTATRSTLYAAPEPATPKLPSLPAFFVRRISNVVHEAREVPDLVTFVAPAGSSREIITTISVTSAPPTAIKYLARNGPMSPAEQHS